MLLLVWEIWDQSMNEPDTTSGLMLLTIWQHNIESIVLKRSINPLAEGIIQGQKVMLVKPQTYMNNSGEAIGEILSYFKIPSQNLIVIYDDIDLILAI